MRRFLLTFLLLAGIFSIWNPARSADEKTSPETDSFGSLPLPQLENEVRFLYAKEDFKNLEKCLTELERRNPEHRLLMLYRGLLKSRMAVKPKTDSYKALNQQDESKVNLPDTPIAISAQAVSTATANTAISSSQTLGAAALTSPTLPALGQTTSTQSTPPIVSARETPVSARETPAPTPAGETPQPPTPPPAADTSQSSPGIKQATTSTTSPIPVARPMVVDQGTTENGYSWTFLLAVTIAVFLVLAIGWKIYQMTRKPLASSGPLGEKPLTYKSEETAGAGEPLKQQTAALSKPTSTDGNALVSTPPRIAEQNTPMSLDQIRLHLGDSAPPDDSDNSESNPPFYSAPQDFSNVEEKPKIEPDVMPQGRQAAKKDDEPIVLFSEEEPAPQPSYPNPSTAPSPVVFAPVPPPEATVPPPAAPANKPIMDFFQQHNDQTADMPPAPRTSDKENTTSPFRSDDKTRTQIQQQEQSFFHSDEVTHTPKPDLPPHAKSGEDTFFGSMDNTVVKRPEDHK